MFSPDLLRDRHVLITGGGTGQPPDAGCERRAGARWLSGSAQNDTAVLLGWDDAQWAALRPGR